VTGVTGVTLVSNVTMVRCVTPPYVIYVTMRVIGVLPFKNLSRGEERRGGAKGKNWPFKVQTKYSRADFLEGIEVRTTE
jgi:hypothetical protein